MDRSPPDPRKSPPGVTPLTVARCVEAPEGPKRQAARPAPKADPSAEIARLVDPGDLVDRALAILAEETEAWNVRRSGNLTKKIPR
jgi:hypothetical protein